jgi:hypothetical protein
MMLFYVSRVHAHREQDIAALRSLQGDVHAHIFARFRDRAGCGSRPRSRRSAPRGGRCRSAPSHRARFEPGAVLVIVRGVDHHQELVPAAAVDERIVDHVRIGGQELAVQALARLQPAAVVAADRIQERGRVRAAHFVHAHVRDVEQPGRLARRQVLLEDAVYCTGISQPANGTILPPRS